MNCGGQMKSFYGGCEEMSMSTVVCPQPRRIHGRQLVFNSPDFDASDELLQILLKKGEEPNQISLSNSFYCGSPPSRVSNPVIHDERFRDETSFVPVPVPPSSRQSFMPTKFGFKPAAMRIEGFDCLNYDGRACSITAKA